jgi:dolichol-phosphate mannosyltransferase
MIVATHASVGAQAIARKFMAHRARMLRFALVGASGVALNSAILHTLVSAGWSPIAASPLATEVTIISNFLLNDVWTFRDRRGRFGWAARIVRYNTITLGGLLITVIVLGVLLRITPLHYLVANLPAIAAGSAWNYCMNLWLIWLRPKQDEPSIPLTAW